MEVTVRLKSPERYRDGKEPLPVLRLEGVFEIDGQQVSAVSNALPEPAP